MQSPAWEPASESLEHRGPEGRGQGTGFPRSGPGSDLGVQPFVSCVLLAKVINISGLRFTLFSKRNIIIALSWSFP